MNKPRAVFFGNRQDLLTHVYPDSRVERLKALADVHPVIVSKDNFDDLLPELSEIDYIFSTWGMPRLTPAQIKQMSALKMVFYGAGTVKYFAEPLSAAGGSGGFRLGSERYSGGRIYCCPDDARGKRLLWIGSSAGV